MAFTYLTPYRRRQPARAGGRSGVSLFDLHSQMNSLFDDLFDQSGDSGFYARSGMAAPAMDIHQDDDKVEITAELPGVKEEDIELTVEESILTLRGMKKSTREDDEGGYRERTYGSFERRITLPPNVDDEACNAEFKDGVLTITLPKKEEKARGRKIPLGKGRSQDQQPGNKLLEQSDPGSRQQSSSEPSSSKEDSSKDSSSKGSSSKESHEARARSSQDA